MNAGLNFDPSIPVQDADTETDEVIYRITHDLLHDGIEDLGPPDAVN